MSGCLSDRLASGALWVALLAACWPTRPTGVLTGRKSSAGNRKWKQSSHLPPHPAANQLLVPPAAAAAPWWQTTTSQNQSELNWSEPIRTNPSDPLTMVSLLVRTPAGRLAVLPAFELQLLQPIEHQLLVQCLRGRDKGQVRGHPGRGGGVPGGLLP